MPTWSWANLGSWDCRSGSSLMHWFVYTLWYPREKCSGNFSSNMRLQLPRTKGDKSGMNCLYLHGCRVFMKPNLCNFSTLLWTFEFFSVGVPACLGLKRLIQIFFHDKCECGFLCEFFVHLDSNFESLQGKITDFYCCHKGVLNMMSFGVQVLSKK